MKTIKILSVIIIGIVVVKYAISDQEEIRIPPNTAYKSEYFKLKYSDPKTGKVPTRSSLSDMAFLDKVSASARTKNDQVFSWFEAGPFDKGGRTRALGIDTRNDQVVITGGVRGGIWKSVDGGQTWYQPEGLVKSESITSLIQYPGLPDTWIATTGELIGSNGTTFLAGAIYRSDDNGESWTPIVYQNKFNPTKNEYEYQQTTLGDLTSAPEYVCDDFCEGLPFLYTNNIIASPTSGEIYIATNGWGILVSKDTLETFQHMLPSVSGGLNQPEEISNDQSTSLLLRFNDELAGVAGETPVNSPAIAYREGIIGQGVFIAADKEIVYEAQDNINPNEGTIEFWIRPEWSGDDNGENDFLLYGDIPGAIFLHRVFGTVEGIVNLAGDDPNFQINNAFGNTDWEAGEWHHLAYSWAPGVTKLYIDGTLVSQAAIPYDLPNLTASTFKIGNAGVSSDAVIDELRISQVARSGSEIMAAFKAGGQIIPTQYPEAKPTHSHITVHPNGDLFAYVQQLGYFLSEDDGATWTAIQDNMLPLNTRSALAFAPSNDQVGYVFSSSQGNGAGFFKVDFSDFTTEDRSANIEVQNEPVNGNGWNLVVAVKPDDENFVVIGGEKLFKSSNGFASELSREETFIGGPPLTIPHVDNHAIWFDPANPNVCWLGNDGGVWKTDDITAVENQLPSVQWQDKNDGYRVTQFYTVAINPEQGTPQLMGGTQDRGSPTINQSQLGTIARFETDAFGGDGAWCWYGKEYAYASAQGGEVRRVNYNENGQPDIDNFGSILIAKLTPEETQQRFFIHPFLLDPNDENILYFPQGNKIYRLLNNLSASFDGMSVAEDWDHHPTMKADDGTSISALSVSTSPPNILYYATRSGTKRIYKVENANSSNPIQKSYAIPEVKPGSFINNIAINPVDPDEIAVVISSFNVPGLFHSTDGGETFTNIEGNLSDSGDLPGPSFEWMDIYIYGDKKYYLLGSRIGLFITDQLDGANTVWELQAEDVIGYQLVNMVVSRSSDGLVALGTHGRGIFTGILTENLTNTSANFTFVDTPTAFNGLGNPQLSSGDELHLSFNISNDGFYNSGPLNVSLLAGDEVLSSYSVENVPGNGSIDIEDWSTGYSLDMIDQFSLIVDYDEKIQESDETDNEALLAVSISDTPMNFSNLSVTGTIAAVNSDGLSEFIEGDELVLSFDIVNSGELEAGAFQLGLEVDGVTVATQEVASSLAPDETNSVVDWATGYTIGTADEFTLVIDTENAVAESNELDNEILFSIAINTTVTAISSIDIPDVFIFPNPAKANDRITINGLGYRNEVRLFDVRGVVHHVDLHSEGDQVYFQLTGLKQGLYIIDVSDDLRQNYLRLRVE